MAETRPTYLDPPVDPAGDHVLGPADAEMTLVEYGSYACPHCHAAHDVVAHLRDRFGDRMTYVFRHLPLADRTEATRAAVLAEQVAVRITEVAVADSAAPGSQALAWGR